MVIWCILSHFYQPGRALYNKIHFIITIIIMGRVQTA